MQNGTSILGENFTISFIANHNLTTQSSNSTPTFLLKGVENTFTKKLSSVQLLSHVQLFTTPWTAARQASPSITNPWRLLKLTSIKSVVPSNHLILSCLLLLLPSIFPSIWVFSSESVLCLSWPMYWNLSFSISPSNEYSGLISFRIDWSDLLAGKGLSRVFSNTTVQKHQFFDSQLSL